MSAPAIRLAVKAAMAGATDKRGRTLIASLMAAVFTPFILIILVIVCLLSGTTEHNQSAVSLVFDGGSISGKIPAEYQGHIKTMQDRFARLDTEISDINDMAEGGTLDDYRVKSIFYALFFGTDQAAMSADQCRKFADCFVRYEEREDEEGDTYTVAIPISDLETVYSNIANEMGKQIVLEDKTNAQRVYVLAKSGGDASLMAGVSMGDGSFSALLAEASRYIGYPYKWGGSSPATSFDCSGYVCWVYTHSGVYNLPRTNAQGIFDQCAVVSRDDAKPGDLIFFTRTYASGTPVSHIGIYVGGSQMLHCGSPIGYANIDSPYWTSHFYAFGRLPVIPEGDAL